MSYRIIKFNELFDGEASFMYVVRGSVSLGLLLAFIMFFIKCFIDFSLDPEMFRGILVFLFVSFAVRFEFRNSSDNIKEDKASRGRFTN